MMLNKTFYLLLLSLIPIFGFSQANSQYPDSGNKIRLGFQTTGDGLIWRDTQPKAGGYQPINNKAAWIILDTMNNKFYHYKNSTWTLAGGQDIDTANLIATKYDLGFKLSLADTQNMLTPYWRSGRFSGVLPMANGGTGSATQNFVDLTTTQSIGGIKTFTSNISINTSGQSRTISTFYPSGSNGNNIFIGGGGNSSTTGGGASYLGSNNSALGVNALYSNTTGYGNSAIGLDALYSNTTGYGNFALGVNALFSNTEGFNNSTIGSSALRLNTTGYSNSAIGSSALYSNTTGYANSAIGLDAGYGTGTNANTTGSNNTFIGYQSVGESSTESNRTWIGNTSTTSTWVGGNLLVGTRTNGTARLQVKGSGVTSSTTALKVDNSGNTNLLTVLDNGNVGIGTTSPTYKLDVSGTGRFADTWGATASNPFLIIERGGSAVSSAIGYDNVNTGMYFGTTTNHKLALRTNNTDVLVLANTGAATFNSSVTANSLSLTTPLSMANGGTGSATQNFVDLTTTQSIGGVKTFTSELTATRFNPTANTATGTGMFLPAANTLGFSTNGTNKLTIDASGNLGLGVSSSAWYTGYTAMQIGESAVLFSNRTSADTRTTQLANNAFLNSNASAWIYAQSDEATRYGQVSGEHQWLTAPSGTAGNAISFTQAMTLDASGRLGIGTTSPLGLLDVYGGAANTNSYIRVNSFEGTYYAALNFSTGGQGENDPQAQIRVVGENNYSANIRFYTQISGTMNPLAERMRITSNGNVGIGTASPNIGGVNRALTLNAATSTNASYELSVNNILQGSLYTNISNASVRLANFNSGDLVFLTGAGGIERMRISSTGAVTINNLGTGTLYTNAGTLTSTNPSDSTLKNSINSYTYGLSEILQLKPKKFYYNSDVTRSYLKYGFIAQDVQPIMPDLVRIISNGNDKLGLESEGIYVAMVNAIQQLSAEIDILKQEIINLKNK